MFRDVALIGVFDMFHYGHLQLIKRASEFGSLTICIVADEIVRIKKGDGKPVINEKQRFAIVASIKYVNDCILVQEFKLSDYVANRSNIVIRGEDQDHIDFSNVREDRIVILPRTKDISTSEIIKKIRINS